MLYCGVVVGLDFDWLWIAIESHLYNNRQGKKSCNYDKSFKRHSQL
jgi:hypothetical protein